MDSEQVIRIALTVVTPILTAGIGIVALVPKQDDPSGRLENTMELAQGRLRLEPVERLCGENCIGVGIRQTGRFGPTFSVAPPVRLEPDATRAFSLCCLLYKNSAYVPGNTTAPPWPISTIFVAWKTGL